jgi:hypothetical protein
MIEIVAELVVAVVIAGAGITALFCFAALIWIIYDYIRGTNETY